MNLIIINLEERLNKKEWKKIRWIPLISFSVKDEAAIQKQDFLESQAAGAAVAAMILKKNKNKFEEAQLMYEVEPSIENAFELQTIQKNYLALDCQRTGLVQ